MDDGLIILSSLNLVEQPLQLLIVDAVEVLSPVYFLQVLFAPLLCVVDLPHEHLVRLAHLGPARLIHESIPTSDLSVQDLPLRLPLDNLRVERERVSDVPGDVLGGARVAGDAHVGEGAGEAIDGRPLHDCLLDAESYPRIEIRRVEDSRVRAISHDLVVNGHCSCL